MPNNNNTYIAASTPVLEGAIFARSWFTFLDMIARKIRILDGTQSNSATLGTADPLPATPAGYMTIIDQEGTPRKVAYYNE